MAYSADDMRRDIAADRAKDAEKRKKRPEAYAKASRPAASASGRGGSGSVGSGRPGSDSTSGGMLGRAKRGIATRNMKNEEALEAARRANRFSGQTTDDANR